MLLAALIIPQAMGMKNIRPKNWSQSVRRRRLGNPQKRCASAPGDVPIHSKRTKRQRSATCGQLWKERKAEADRKSKASAVALKMIQEHQKIAQSLAAGNAQQEILAGQQWKVGDEGYIYTRPLTKIKVEDVSKDGLTVTLIDKTFPSGKVFDRLKIHGLLQSLNDDITKNYSLMCNLHHMVNLESAKRSEWETLFTHLITASTIGDPKSRNRIKDLKEKITVGENAEIPTNVSKIFEAIEKMRECKAKLEKLGGTSQFQQFSERMKNVSLKKYIVTPDGKLSETQNIPALRTKNPLKNEFFKLYDVCKDNEEKFKTYLETIKEKLIRHKLVKGTFEIHTAKVKNDIRAGYKYMYKYNWDAKQLTDLLRGTIQLDTLTDSVDGKSNVEKVLDALEDHFEGIVRIKDRFSSPPKNGYRDMLVNVVYVNPENGNKIVCEIQIHQKECAEIKESGGHDSYKIARHFGKSFGEIAFPWQETWKNELTNTYAARFQDIYKRQTELKKKCGRRFMENLEKLKKRMSDLDVATLYGDDLKRRFGVDPLAVETLSDWEKAYREDALVRAHGPLPEDSSSVDRGSKTLG